MEECRLLTRKDAGLVLPYLEVFRKGLVEISSLYSDKNIIEEAVRIYTPEYMEKQLSELSPESRFIAHLSKNSLAGILIEGFDTINFDGSREKNNITKIKWVFGSKERRGVGSQLILDCLNRAREEEKDAVNLAVSQENLIAIQRYSAFGFKEVARENGVIGMYKFFNPRMDPANWEGNVYKGR